MKRDRQSITSRDNPSLQQLRLLSESARERKFLGQTVLDGAHLLAAYLESGHTPRAVWLSESGLANAEIAALAARCEESPQYLVPDALLRHVAPTDTPSGVLAIIDIPQPQVSAPIATVMVLDALQDAGNVGSMLRTAAAAGVREAWLTQGCAQAWSPKVLRAGMGAHFSLTLHEGVDVLAKLEGAQVAVIATALSGATSLYEQDLSGPVVWLFGSEGAGVSEPLLARATARVRIPMPGRTESLNAGAAAAVCLFEQVRRNLQP